MNRRSLLAGLGAGAAGLSGCLGIGTSTTSTPTDTGSEDTDQQFQNRTVNLDTIDREPRKHNVALTGEMTEPEVIVEHTATLRLTFTNEGDSESMDVAGVRDDMPVIAEDFTYSAPQEYLLVPPRYAQPDRKETCWEVPHEVAFNGSNAGGEPLHLPRVNRSVKSICCGIANRTRCVCRPGTITSDQNGQTRESHSNG